MEWPVFSGAGTTTARICWTNEPSAFARPAVSIPVHLAGIGAMPSWDPAWVHPTERRAVGERPASGLVIRWASRVRFRVRSVSWRAARPRRDHRYRTASRQQAFQDPDLSPVDREVVLPSYLDDTTRKPAPVPFRQPLGRVLVALLVPIHPRTCERQIQRVVGEPALGVRAGGAQPAVMRLGTGHQVLDVSLPLRLKPLPRIGRVDATEVRDDGVFDTLRVAVVVRVVTAATLFGCYAEAPPGLLWGRRRYGGHRGGSENCPEDNYFGAARDQGRYAFLGGCNLRCDVAVMSSRKCMALLGLRCNSAARDAGRRSIGYALHAGQRTAAPLRYAQRCRPEGGVPEPAEPSGLMALRVSLRYAQRCRSEAGVPEPSPRFFAVSGGSFAAGGRDAGLKTGAPGAPGCLRWRGRVLRRPRLGPRNRGR